MLMASFPQWQGAKTKQNGYSYFKVAIYIQAQKGGAIKQPEQTHHWSGALAQPCGSYISWGLAGSLLVAGKMLQEVAESSSRYSLLQVPQALASAWARA